MIGNAIYNIQIFDEVIGNPGSAEGDYQSVQNVPVLDKKGELKVCMSLASTAFLLSPPSTPPPSEALPFP